MTRRKNQKLARRGAILPLVALTLTALLAACALAIDLGRIYEAKQRAQEIVDAAALAGGPEMPSLAQATAAANQVIAANGVSADVFTTMLAASPITRDDGTALTVPDGHGLTVQGTCDAPLTFAPVIGYRPQGRGGAANTLSVPARATVIVQPVCELPAGSGVAPFGLRSADPNIAPLLSAPPAPGVYLPSIKQLTLVITLWQGDGTLPGGVAGTSSSIGPLLTSGQGTQYQDTIRFVTDQALSTGQTLSTYATGPATLTSQTRTGINSRLSPSDTQFSHTYNGSSGNQSGSAYAQWFFGDAAQPIDSAQPPVTDGANTYYYHQDPHRQEITDAHLLIIPVVQTSAQNGTVSASIIAFATFFIEQPYQSGTSTVKGRFIGLTLPGGSGGNCAEAGARTSPRLVQ